LTAFIDNTGPSKHGTWPASEPDPEPDTPDDPEAVSEVEEPDDAEEPEEAVSSIVVVVVVVVVMVVVVIVVDDDVDDDVDDEDDVDVAVVVGQSPSNNSSSFVAAPVMQVPSTPEVLSALLQPHAPVQSLPHIMLLQGSTVVVAVIFVDVLEVVEDDELVAGVISDPITVIVPVIHA